MAKLPILPTQPGQLMPNQRYFLRPFVRAMSNKFRTLTEQIDKAHVQHHGKEMMKIVEDPWENFLYYDSKYVLPILCHSVNMTIEEQALVAMFIQKSVADETISQYKLQGAKLVDALLKFIREEYTLSLDAAQFEGLASEENHPDESGDEADVVDDLLKIRKSKRGVEEGENANANDENNSDGLLGRLKKTCASKGSLATPEIEQTVAEVDRALKMFFLHMKMSGQLKEFKEDYFV